MHSFNKRKVSFAPSDIKTLRFIYDKNRGYCVYCNAKLAFTNHGRLCEKGAWEVDHSNPRSRGGTDHMNNLVPACIFCNREKSDRTARTFKAYIDRNWSNKETYRQSMRRKYCD
ncbi:MAG: HNH endonuclease [Candidatus Thorarchaeota archaeon]